MPKKTWGQRLTGLGFLAMCISIALLIVVGPGHRFGIVPTGLAVLSSAAATLIAVFAVLVTVIGLLVRDKDQPLRNGRVALTLLLAGAVSLQLIGWIVKATSVPQIHDITTDTADPPAFEALASARANAANPLAYAGEEAAEAQRTAYPDLATQTFAGVSIAQAVSAAETAAKAMGFDPVIVTGGTVEATDTTFWYGYKDDVVVRVRDSAGTAVIDIRSKSRVGKSDLGTNAARIRNLQAAIAGELSGS
ncbi:MAG: DUF1499 domain-containing protein [Pseudomonadota bacterium]